MLCVDADGRRRIFDAVLDPWQRRDLEALDAGWRLAVEGTGGEAVEAGVFQRAYLERPRGHSKTTDLAVMVSWALFASRRRIVGNAVAADRDQARLLRAAIRGLTQMNGWLREFVDPQRDKVINPHTGSELSILSSDAPSAYGQTPDFVICDELTHWPRAETWSAVFSAAAKRRHCMLVVISNAGNGQGKPWPESQKDKKCSWQWRVREAARNLPGWCFSRLDGPQASWITAEMLEEQQALLPTTAYLRLWRNTWSEEAGDALDPADISASLRLPSPAAGGVDGMVYGVGVDLGVKRDHAAYVVLGTVPGSRRVQLVECRSWAPDPETRSVNLMAVEAAIADAARRFDVWYLSYDPHQAALMAQRLAVELEKNLIERPFSGPNCMLMASSVLAAFRGRQIDLYDDPQLLADLRRLSIAERNYGFRLVATADENGHADRATALAIALPEMLEIANWEAAAESEAEPLPSRVEA